jgi:hypothetical protein
MVRVMDLVAADSDIVRDLMRECDSTLLHENLKLSFEQRARKHLRVLQMVEELRRAGQSRDRKVMAVDLAQVIPPLVREEVDFILIGGMAAILHGSARVTFDVDVVYSRTHDTLSASLRH